MYPLWKLMNYIFSSTTEHKVYQSTSAMIKVYICVYIYSWTFCLGDVDSLNTYSQGEKIIKKC